MFVSAKKRFSKRKTDFEKFLTYHKSRISLIVFLGGFIFDIFTLTKVDVLVGNLVLSGYLVVALFSIVLMNWGDYKNIKNKILYKIYQYSPFITQLSFGALFSGFVVYYTTSGSLVASWPFLLVLYMVFVANEKIKKYYERFEFQISIFFASFLSLSIYFLPILSKKVGDEIFIASGFIAIFFSFWIIKGIIRILPVLKKKRIKIFMNMFFIFLVFNLSYFFQVIPPVPLSIKNIELAHNIEKINSNGQIKYILTQDTKQGDNFYEKWKNIFYKNPGEKIYIFSSVHAPRGLKTHIIHNWEFFDQEQQKWVSVRKIKYEIVGGRDGGYRGFSYLSEARDGSWRVNIENKSGLLIGRENFEVLNGERLLKLESKILGN